MTDKKTIYLDYAASTPLDEEVLKVMMEVEREFYANPSSVHYPGQRSKVVLENARRTIAESIQARAQDVIFTSGGTESNNIALIGTARANRSKGNHIITTAIEHPSLLECCKFLATEGFRITYLAVDQQGQINLTELQSSLTADTILVSVMLANNETGCILPIWEIGQILKARKILFHCDAVQAYSKIDISVIESNVDLLSLSAHKIYGPKGIGALYIGNNIPFEKIMYGGAQELNRRPGTENIAGIAGFAAAVRQMDKNRSERKRIKDLRDYLENELKRQIPAIGINGEQAPRLFSHANVYFPFISGDLLMMNLDIQGIAVSVGSACSSGSVHPSHVLTAMGLDTQRINGSVRFSLGRFSTTRQIEQTISALVKIYQDRSKGVA